MIYLTQEAVDRLKRISQIDHIGHLMVRVGLTSGSCSGFSYNILFDDLKRNNDQVFEQDGITILVDHISFGYIDETTIGYENKLMSSGFTFANKRIKNSCGCQRSVEFDKWK